MVMLAVLFAIMLMCVFYFAIGHFALKFIFKKNMDPVLLFCIIAFAVIGMMIGQALWYHQPLNTNMVLPASIILIIFLRRMRKNRIK
ncbi:hypothetical protein G8C92_17555 [Paenibacillus donghaensis]|uniref:hypothetical protein n=1 Tax=Paenibacillus donghaensis TaxID=414771 RepID=UPI00188471F1|nr:hypothetical protein [Paenibacillus donghaensis]MBE9915823.1 hypothetical protein [Paenibacillus donghaensis]